MLTKRSNPLAGPTEKHGLEAGTAGLMSAGLGVLLVLGAFAFDLGSASTYSLPKSLFVGVFPAALLALTLLRCALRKNPRLLLPREFWLLTTFGVVALASAASAACPGGSVSCLVHLLQMSVWLVLGSLTLNSATAQRRFLLGLSVAGAGVSALGLLQWLALDGWLVESPLARLAGLPQVDRPASTFGHVNMASEVALLGFLAVAMLPKGRAFPRLGTAWRSVAALLCVSFILVGGSRAAWFGGLLGATGIMAVRFWRLDSAARREVARRWGLVIAALVVVLVAVDAHVDVPGRGGGASVHPSDRVLELLSLDSGTEHERLVLWRNSVAMWLDAPLLGVGPGNWVVKFPAYARASATLDPEAYNLQRQPEAAHMESLQLLCETGVAGFLLMALVFVGALARGVRRAENDAFVGLVVATLAMSVAAYVFQNPFPAAVCWLALGALAGSAPPLLRGDAVVTRVWPMAFLCAAGAAVLALFFDAEQDASRALQEGRVLRNSIRSAPELHGRALRQRALDALDRAVAARPGDWRLQAERALALWDLGLMDDALAAFDRTLAINPDFVNALLLKAILLHERDDLDASFELLRRALFVQPEAPELRFALGRVLEAKARKDSAQPLLVHAAASQYRQAANAREFMPLARVALARILLAEEGSVAEIMRLLDKAEENAALMPGVLVLVARLREHPALAAAAPGIQGPGGVRTQRIWQRVLGLAPGHAEAGMELALAHWQQGSTGRHDPEPVLAALDAAARGGVAPARVHYHRARVLEAAERIHEALVEWTWIARAGVAAWRDEPLGLLLTEEAHVAVVRLRQRLP